MANRTASYDKSYVGSSQPRLKSDNLRKREQAAKRTFQAALACGLNHRQAAQVVALTMAAGVTAAQSPLARAVVQVECETKTRSLVMAIRERNARRAA